MSASLLVIAGEVSGDMHAGPAVLALRSRLSDLTLFGIGGDEMEAAGVELIVHAREMAVFGMFAALRRYWFFRKVFRQVREAVAIRQPVAALLVDYGGFNLRLAKVLRADGVKVIYFISPQVWASRPGRIKKMEAWLDRLLVIFPFEPRVFSDTSLQVDYVGHPLVDSVEEAQATMSKDLPWPGAVRIGLLPGSRAQEIDNHLPIMVEAAQRIGGHVPEAGFLVAAHDAGAESQIRGILTRISSGSENISVVTGQAGEVLRQARACWVASGTATLEAALFNCPHTIVYRASPLLYAVARILIKVKYIGMVNLVVGREVCKELIQGKATAEELTRVLLPLLDDTPERQAMVDAFRELRSRLGPGGAVQRVADILAEELNADG